MQLGDQILIIIFGQVLYQSIRLNATQHSNSGDTQADMKLVSRLMLIFVKKRFHIMVIS